MKYWRDQFSTGYRNALGQLDVSANQSSMIVSLLSAGTFFGALTAAPAGDFLGRRYGLMASTVVFTLGVILQTAADAIPMFVAGRFFAGYGVGMISALIPLYQSETAPKWIRGTIVGKPLLPPNSVRSEYSPAACIALCFTVGDNTSCTVLCCLERG